MDQRPLWAEYEEVSGLQKEQTSGETDGVN